MSIPNPNIDVPLVRRLVASQFPDWAHLPIEPVDPGGWDNRTFRLGREMLVRMPRHARYDSHVGKEQSSLPFLGPLLPLQIPVPLAEGRPGHGYEWPWSIYRWLCGAAASVGPVEDMELFAVDLAGFLRALQEIDPDGGSAPGAHNFFRGGPLDVYDAEMRAAIEASGQHVDTRAAARVWESALGATWNEDPVWLHGDLAPSNLLVRDGRLTAVIDFGCSGVGDPACDLVIAWTFLSGSSREVFRSVMSMDGATWARARGWALWKASTTGEWGVVRDVVAEHDSEA